MNKKFLAQWVISLCFMFTVIQLLYLMSRFLGGQTVAPLTETLSIFLLSLVATFLQLLCFTDSVIKKMRYSYRLGLFAVTFLPLLSLIAIVFGWIPNMYVGPWLVFLAIFVAIFIATAACFEVYFRLAGKKYDGLLGQYKKAQEERQEPPEEL
ncbi:MAG: hypothetical protein Q4C25_06120 [Bacillota bacterium]|nr:hypothetical protein [Bacillota bacterium]